MSRIGNKPVDIPSGVKVAVDKTGITVEGKSKLTLPMPPLVAVEVKDNQVHVTEASEDRKASAMQGLTRSLIHNMIVGVTDGYKKELDVNGVGYRVAKEGKNLVMNLGFSHQVIVSEIEGITIDVPAPNKIVINGCDKQAVGQFAAEVREKRPPEPYKGKGIKYADEVIRRKVGKTGAKK